METSLHHQLKDFYAQEGDEIEVRLGEYIIDVVSGDELIEVQCASLGAIRDKIKKLLRSHEVRVVKPIVARKYLVKKAADSEEVISARFSPLKKSWPDVFDELVNFVTVFPHRRLSFEIALIEVEEHRIPIEKKRWKKKDYKTTDRILKNVQETRTIRTAEELWDLLPGVPQGQFTTAELAKAAQVSRWMAQKIAYCLRHTKCVNVVGKQGNAILYEKKKRRKKRKVA